MRKLSLTLMKFETVSCTLTTDAESGACSALVQVDGVVVPACVAYTLHMPSRGVMALMLVLEGEPFALLTAMSSFDGLIQVDWS